MHACNNKGIGASLGLVALAILFLAPFAFLFSGLWSADYSVLQTVFSSVFYSYLLNTVILAIFVIIGSVAIGASTAWLTNYYEFPLRRFIKILLPISVVISPYMRAIVFSEYADALSFSFIPFIKNIAPNIASFIIPWVNIPFLIATLVFSLYPYVYFLVDAAYMRSSQTLIESARILNAGQRSLFRAIGIPIARTALIGAIALVFMDVLNEYAAVVYFGFPTISSGIYRTWFSYGDLGASKVLALCVLIIVIMSLYLMKRGSSKSVQYDIQYYAPIIRSTLPRHVAIATLLYCSIPVIFGFAVPVCQFIYWATFALRDGISYSIMVLIKNTIFLMSVAVPCAAALAIAVSFACHIRCTKMRLFIYKSTTLGYAVPSVIIAIAILSFFYLLNTLLAYIFPNENIAHFFLGKTIIALVFASILRFFFVIANPIYTGFHHYGSRYENAARSLGVSIKDTFFKISFPLNTPFIVNGILLFIVEVLKEIPMTLMLRPFNFDTLSIKTYLLARDEMIIQSSIPMLITVAIGLVCIAGFHVSQWNIRREARSVNT